MKYLSIILFSITFLFTEIKSELINKKDNAELIEIEPGSVEVGLPETQVLRILEMFKYAMQKEAEKGWLTRELPLRKEVTNRFWIYKYEVTNKMFAQFIKETAYITKAEKEKFGFVMGAKSLRKVYGAFWKKPKGAGSSIETILDHPVVQVCLEDINAYSKWAQARLPKEKEWLKAANGGFFLLYPWGNYWKDGYANYGRYPDLPVIDASDGYINTSPVGHYEKGKSQYGCYDLAGNVWEWTETTIEKKGSILYIIKGGSWFSNLFCLRTTCYALVKPNFRCDGLGFRLVCDKVN